jgi:hypothetical protein
LAAADSLIKLQDKPWWFKHGLLQKNVTVWAERYKRDHVVYPAIIRQLVDSGVAPLLSCVKLPLNRRPASLSALSTIIDEANSILSLYIEAGLLYLREPSFQPKVFSNLPTLLRYILVERIEGVKALQRLGLGGETELISVLIEPMMPILMLYEETSLAESNQPLSWANPIGALQEFHYAPDRRFACRFSTT